MLLSQKLQSMAMEFEVTTNESTTANINTDIQIIVPSKKDNK
jgi:hypothetical protein